jgi:hypothetical protein
MKIIKEITDFYQSQDAFVFWPISCSIILALSVIATWGLLYLNLPWQLPIFYSLAWGESQFGHINQFLIFPSLIILIILTNLIISWHLHFSQILIKRILATTSFIVAIFLSIAAFKIIFTFV